MQKVLLVGVGDVGKHLLEFAARDENWLEWVVGDIDRQKAQWAPIAASTALPPSSNILIAASTA